MTSRAQDHHQGGFTLIELLVVIVVLGILSGIVVFAVRGAGDKGAGAALAADERTIRLAEEAACAKEGRYLEMGELVSLGYLSAPSELHTVTLTTGPCNGTGYELVRPVTSTTTAGAPTTTVGPSACTYAGEWCRAGDLNIAIDFMSTPNSMIRLPSGKVLGFGPKKPDEYKEVPTVLYDPAADPAGQWSDGPSAHTNFGADGFNTAVVIEGSAGECGDRCGNVLVHFGGFPGQWQLYNPSAPLDKAWTPIPPVDPSTNPPTPNYKTRNYTARAVQLTGPGCAPRCGQVLVLGGGGETARTMTPPAELYNPKDNKFTEITPHYEAGGLFLDPAAVRLKDGRVLVVLTDPRTRPPASIAKLFDPATGLFNDGDAPSRVYVGTSNPLTVLPDGTVLAISRPTSDPEELPPLDPEELPPLGQPEKPDGGAELYHPDADGGGGSWTGVPTCGAGNNPNAGCYVLGSLPDGTVVANGNADSDDRVQNGSRDVFLFDPVRKEWRQADLPFLNAPGAGVLRCAPQCGKLLSGDTPGAGVLLEGDGCAPQCGKLLAAGRGSAELYTAP